MRTPFTSALLFLFTITTFGQQTQNTEKVWRANFLNPAIELELPTGTNSTFSTALGIGYGGGYPDLTSGDSGFVYIISPFLEAQQKWFYNFDKRNARGKSIDNNSGNFISLRFIGRGPSIADNVIRTTDFDFAIGPTWGMQRKWGKNFHVLLDVGPQIYFDTNGNTNIWPIMVQINLGFDL